MDGRRGPGPRASLTAPPVVKGRSAQHGRLFSRPPFLLEQLREVIGFRREGPDQTLDPVWRRSASPTSTFDDPWWTPVALVGVDIRVGPLPAGRACGNSRTSSLSMDLYLAFHGAAPGEPWLWPTAARPGRRRAHELDRQSVGVGSFTVASKWASCCAHRPAMTSAYCSSEDDVGDGDGWCAFALRENHRHLAPPASSTDVSSAPNHARRPATGNAPCCSHGAHLHTSTR